MSHLKSTFERRNFLKSIGMTAAGVSLASPSTIAMIQENNFSSAHTPFNMSGYSAPALERVRIGIIGMGARGTGALERLLKIEQVDIIAVCDLRESQVTNALQIAHKYGQKPTGYHSDPEIWKKLCERSDLDAVYIVTPWQLHTSQAVFAMEHGKHVFVEVPAATTLEECWQLVNTSEKTRKHCVQLENCCYDFFEMLVLNMVQKGILGEIIHTEGAYIHDLADMFLGDRFYQKWELKEAVGKMGNLYPTHGLGPLCQVLNINRGDRLDFLVSLSTNDFTMQPLVNERAKTDKSLRDYVGQSFNGNMNTTTIRTTKGKSIVLQYDVSSPRPYTRIQLVSGTKGATLKYPLPPRIALGHQWVGEEEFKQLEEQYTPPIIKKIGEIAKRVGGHGGMDFLMDWRNIDCLRNGLPMDQDVYDAATWSAITPLSIASVQQQSTSVKVPDFTRGNWQQNSPIDLSMHKGGTTSVRS